MKVALIEGIFMSVTGMIFSGKQKNHFLQKAGQAE